MAKLTVLSYLTRHASGPHNAKLASTIQVAIGIRPAVLRDIVNTLRCEGYPIGSGQRGYFYARSYSELQPTIDHLNSRRSHIEDAIEGLERAYLINRR